MISDLVVRPRRRTAFTLIEILIVVAILAMVASLGVLPVLRARITAQEHAALNEMRQIAKACQSYLAVNQAYPSGLQQLALPAANPPYLNESLVGDGTTLTKQGYTFAYAQPNPDEPGSTATFRILANPVTHGVTGERHFIINQTMATYATAEDRDATISDMLLQ